MTWNDRAISRTESPLGGEDNQWAKDFILVLSYDPCCTFMHILYQRLIGLVAFITYPSMFATEFWKISHLWSVVFPLLVHGTSCLSEYYAIGWGG
jgi:hypothetical protein